MRDCLPTAFRDPLPSRCRVLVGNAPTCAPGGYDEADSYVRLDSELKEYEASVGGKGGNRLFFLSIPPTIFGAVCTEIGKSARAGDGFTHLIIEKPFGRDSASFEELNSCTSALFDESQLFRIDHYLGKEIVLNIANLRFGARARHTVYPSPPPHLQWQEVA